MTLVSILLKSVPLTCSGTKPRRQGSGGGGGGGGGVRDKAYNISHVRKKQPAIGFSDQVRHKPGYTQ